MNIGDNKKAQSQPSAALIPLEAAEQRQPASTSTGKASGAADSLQPALRGATPPKVAPAPASQNMRSPIASVSNPPKTAHTAMDAEKAAVVAQLSHGATLNDAAEAARRIAELHGKPRHADEVCAMAELLIEDKERREQVKLAASLVVLGEWKSPAHILLGGRLSDEDRRAHILPINARAAEVLRKIPGGAALAGAIEGVDAKGVAPWLHACRDISAMDAPRKWRQDAMHPDGRLSLEEIDRELGKNDACPGRAPWVTAELFARYQALRSD